MLLSDLALPMPYADCRGLALVYPYEVAVALYAVQEAHGDPRHVPAGLPLTDGRWMLCGGVLSEVGEGGFLPRRFAHISPDIMARVQVLPLGDVLDLLAQVSDS